MHKLLHEQDLNKICCVVLCQKDIIITHNIIQITDAGGGGRARHAGGDRVCKKYGRTNVLLLGRGYTNEMCTRGRRSDHLKTLWLLEFFKQSTNKSKFMCSEQNSAERGIGWKLLRHQKCR